MAIFWSLPRADDTGVLGVHDEPICPLGSQYHDAETGYIWQYLKAGENLVFGDALVPNRNMHTVTDLATAAEAGSMEINDTTENFLTSLPRVKPKSKQKEMAMLQIVGGTGVGQRAVITEIYQTRLVVEWLTSNGALETALGTDTDIEIFADWLATKSGTKDVSTIGFVQQLDGVQQDEYFWALWCGKGTVRKAAGSITRGAALTADAGGRVTTLMRATDGSTNSIRTCGSALVETAAVGNLFANLKAEHLIGEVPVRTDVGYQASSIAPPATGSA